MENWKRLKWHEVKQYESKAVREVYIINTEMKKLDGTSLLAVRRDTIPSLFLSHSIF